MRTNRRYRADNRTVRPLVVERGGDDASVSTALRADDRIEPTTADRAEDVLDRLAAGGADCLVATDRSSAAEGDALSVVEAVREVHPEIPVVFVAAAGSEELAGRAVRAGVADYVTADAPDLCDRILDASGEPTDRANVHHLNAVFNDPLRAITLLDPDGTVRRTNEQSLELVDAAEADVVGQPYPETPWWNHSESERDRVREAVETAGRGEPVRYSATSRGVDGERLVIDLSIRPLYEGDEVVQLLAEGIDITERTRLKTELNEILDRITDAFFALDDDWRFTYVNARAEALLERKEEELLGRTVWEEFSSALGTEFEAQYARAMEEQVPVNFEEHFPPLDTWFSVWAYPSETGLSVYFRDISEQKAIRESLRHERTLKDRILETSPIGITIVDDRGRFAFSNERAAEVLGVSEEELNDSNYDDPVFDIRDERGEPLPVAERPYSRVMDEGEPVFGQEFQIVRPDGDAVWVSVNGAPLEETDDGSVTSAVFAIEDITDRKGHEEELERTVEKLRRSNEKLQRFAYITSHDLQEPLRMVSSYLQLLERRYADELDEEANEFIDYAVGGAERMRDMINDLLKYSRIDTHGQEFAPTDFEAVLTDVEHNLEVAVEESGAEITADELPTVTADGNQMTQLLQNLVNNSIKYAGDEPPRIHVSAERRDGEWVFSVADNGIGIDPEHADGIFDVFKRLHNSEEYSGTGIGLAICQKIIERHDGDIWVESASGKGATFYFTLPSSGADSS